MERLDLGEDAERLRREIEVMHQLEEDIRGTAEETRALVIWALVFALLLAAGIVWG